MAAKARNHLIDNTKALLIYLVVLGHLITLGAKSADLWSYAWTFIFAFHMPAFFFVSGIFAKSNEDKNSRSVLNLAILYVFGVVLVTVVKMICGQGGDFNFANPPFACWFLLALCIIRLILPLAKHIKFIMPISIAIALLSGLNPDIGTTLSAARVLYFLPFFLAGYFLGLDGILSLRSKLGGWKRIAIVVVALGLIVGLWAAMRCNADIPWAILRVKASYAAMGMSNLAGIGMRAVAMVTGALSTLALLICLPQKENKLTFIGRNCLSVYLLHTIIIVALREVTIPLDAFQLGWLFVALAAVITLICAAPIFNKAITTASGKLTELLWRPFDKRA